MPLNWDATPHGGCAVCGETAEATIWIAAKTIEKPIRSLGSHSRKLCRRHTEEVFAQFETVLRDALEG